MHYQVELYDDEKAYLDLFSSYLTDNNAAAALIEDYIKVRREDLVSRDFRHIASYEGNQIILPKQLRTWFGVEASYMRRKYSAELTCLGYNHYADNSSDKYSLMQSLTDTVYKNSYITASSTIFTYSPRAVVAMALCSHHMWSEDFKDFSTGDVLIIMPQVLFTYLHQYTTLLTNV